MPLRLSASAPGFEADFAAFIARRRDAEEDVAGIVAGLLYAFHPFRLGNITHPSIWDTTWTVFALYFSHRLFAAGR